MKSVLELVQVAQNLKPISNNDIYIQEITETIGGVKIEKIAIYQKGCKHEIEKALNFESTKHCVVMYKKQFDLLFKPIFQQIGELNKTIRSIQ